MPTYAELIAAGYSEAHAREFAKYGYIRKDRRTNPLPKRTPRASGHSPKARKGDSTK